MGFKDLGEREFLGLWILPGTLVITFAAGLLVGSLVETRRAPHQDSIVPLSHHGRLVGSIVAMSFYSAILCDAVARSQRKKTSQGKPFCEHER